MRQLRNATREEILDIISKVKDNDLDSVIKLLRDLRIDDFTNCWFRNADWSIYNRGIKIENELYATHRLSYKLFNGPLIEGHEICHHCDVRGCWNPKHLFQGTHSDNIKDAINKGRIQSIRISKSKKIYKQTDNKLHKIEQVTKEVIYREKKIIGPMTLEIRKELALRRLRKEDNSNEARKRVIELLGTDELPDILQ